MHLEDSVRINIKGYLNLWLSSSHWRNALKIKHPKRFIISRKLSFSLRHVHSYGVLIVRSCGIDIRLFRWNSSISRDHHMSDSSLNFNRKRKRSHIKQKNIFHISLHDSTLDCRTLSNGFIRVYGRFRLFSEDFPYDCLYFEHSRRTSHQNDVVDFRFF